MPVDVDVGDDEDPVGVGPTAPIDAAAPLALLGLGREPATDSP
jgi:hypothetical protein